MVNEFLSLSPGKQDELNERDYFNASVGSPQTCESSDDDTTSSSLLRIPDTLDIMRNELNTTINCLYSPTIESPKPNDFKPKEINFNASQPLEREVSIVQKITSANHLLDDLLDASNVVRSQIKEVSPLVFSAKTILRKRPFETSETVSDPSTESTTSSSADNCPAIPIAPFLFPSPVCKCNHCPCEKNENLTQIQSEPVRPPEQPPQKQRKRYSLKQKMMAVRQKYKKKKTPPTKNQGQEEKQTQEESPKTDQPPDITLHIPQCNCSYHDLRVQAEAKCTCPVEHPITPSPQPICTCPSSVRTIETDDHSHENKPYKEIESDHINNLSEDKQKENQKTKEELPQVTQVEPVRNPRPVKQKKGRDRIDIYYFDHGNSAYYRTTDSHPAKLTENIIERTDEYATRFWAEVFGTVTIAMAFVISFILQLYRCLFTAIIRSLTVGLIQIFSDYFFKPLLTVIFNGLIQPCLILGYNIATSLRDFCVPICEICEFCAKGLATVFKSCRLVEVNQAKCSYPSCPCTHNV